MRSCRIALTLLLWWSVAQPGNVALSAATPHLAAHAVPEALRLQAMPFAYQSFNNCGPQSIASILGYYGIGVSQQVVAKATKREPRGYMTAQAIQQYVARYGLDARRFILGQRRHLQALLRLGVPIIVLQWVDRNAAVPHFRVVTGFDDGRGVFMVLDPLFGSNLEVSYSVFDQLWTVNHSEFIPVYPATFEHQVFTALGLGT